MDQATPQAASQLQERLEAGEPGLLPGEADLLLVDVQRLAGIGMLTAGVAQELANLLSIVTTASISLRYELQQQNSQPDEMVQHYINLIERNAFRSAQIASMLQKYGATQTVQMAITDVDTILRDTLMLVERQFREESSIRFAVHAPGETLSVICDHNRIVQLLVNVLLNVRDSMPDSGGLIEIKAHALAGSDVAGSNGSGILQEAGIDRVAIMISDEGAGIAESNGRGLRMRIAREIVRQHQGDMLFSNDRGPAEGASVTVVLPVRPSS